MPKADRVLCTWWPVNGFLYDLLNSYAERRLIGPLREELLSSLEGTIVEVGAGTGANFRTIPVMRT